MKTRAGQNVLKARRAKRRKKLCAKNKFFKYHYGTLGSVIFVIKFKEVRMYEKILKC